MTIFPIPKSLTVKEGTCPASAPVRHETDASLKQEEYRIDITAQGITLTSSCGEGDFRAQSTLKQILGQSGDTLPCLSLHDWPDFPVRGLWHNINTRQPTMEEFKHEIDLMADMKINLIQIELGSNTFNAPSFPSMHLGKTPYTAEELQELAEYARARYVNLAPGMQTFGHIPDWLANPEFADLAECPDGFEMWGTHHPPMTLNPLDPRSIQLATKRLGEVIPIMGSDLFNICCDETWELGQGKSKEECEKRGRTRVFLDFMSQLIEFVNSQGVKPMFWADIILQGSQEVLNAIPKDSIAMNWGYERGEVTEESCIRLQKTGVPYWNCPGTSVWASLLGQSYKAVQNIARCAVLGKRHGACGLFNTDWPDHGLHFFSTAYFGVAYGAAMGWSVDESEWHPIEGEDKLQPIIEPDAAQLAKVSPTVAACFDYLNRFVYEDSRNKMAQIVYDAGLYGHLSAHHGIHNTTQIKRILVQDPAQTDVYGYDAQDLIDTKDYLNVILYRLAHEPRMTCQEAQLLLDEYRDQITMLLYGCDLGLYRVGELQGYTEESYAAMMRTRGQDILREHGRVWTGRYRGQPLSGPEYFRQFDQ